MKLHSTSSTDSNTGKLTLLTFSAAHGHHFSFFSRTRRAATRPLCSSLDANVFRLVQAAVHVLFYSCRLSKSSAVSDWLWLHFRCAGFLIVSLCRTEVTGKLPNYNFESPSISVGSATPPTKMWNVSIHVVRGDFINLKLKSTFY